MKPLNNDTKIAIGILLLILLVVINIIQTNNTKIKQQQDIKAYRYETVGEVKKYTNYDDGPIYYIVYFYNDKKYEATNLIFDQKGKSCIGKYYKLELSNRNPQFANILLNQEVTDTVIIKRAGFMKNYVEKFYK